MISEGTYEAIPVPGTLQFGRTNNGNGQVAVDLKIEDGPEAGRVIQWIGFFTPPTARRTLESLQYMGMKGDDLDLLHDNDLNLRVQIVVAHEEYKGKVRARVQWVNRIGGFRFEKTLGKDDLKELSKQIRQWSGADESLPEPNF